MRAAAKRARGCSSAKRTHLRAAMAASRTAAAYCARSARSAPSEARAASASRSSTPDGFLFCGPQESKRDKHESAAKARGGEAEADAQERAVRKPYQSCRTGCERAHWSMYIMLQRRLFSPPLSASTEPMATLRRGATCGADVAAACGNALTSWSDFVRQSVTPSSPSSGYLGRKMASQACHTLVTRSGPWGAPPRKRRLPRKTGDQLGAEPLPLSKIRDGSAERNGRPRGAAVFDF